jgi:hypothetical protein
LDGAVITHRLGSGVEQDQPAHPAGPRASSPSRR